MVLMTTTVDGVQLDDRKSGDGELVEEAIRLADGLLRQAIGGASRSERRRLERLGTLVADPAGRELVQRLTDDVLRIRSPRRAGQRFAEVVGQQRLPDSLGVVDRTLMTAGARAARVLPRVVMPLVRRRILARVRQSQSPLSTMELVESHLYPTRIVRWGLPTITIL